MIITSPFGAFFTIRRVLLILGGLAVASCAAQMPGPGDDDDDDDDTAAARGRCPAASPGPISLELLAGSLGGPGNADGTGPAAAFHLPQSVAVDSSGNVYVADSDNSTIRKSRPPGS